MQVIPGHPWVEMMGKMDANIVRSYEKAFPAKCVSRTIKIIRWFHSIVLRHGAKIIEKLVAVSNGTNQYSNSSCQNEKAMDKEMISA